MDDDRLGALGALGELEETAEGPRLRFVRHLAHSADVVRRSLTEPQHLGAWFPQRIEGRFEVGTVLRFGPRAGEGYEPFAGPGL